jgi:hypothetical protein
MVPFSMLQNFQLHPLLPSLAMSYDICFFECQLIDSVRRVRDAALPVTITVAVSLLGATLGCFLFQLPSASWTR